MTDFVSLALTYGGFTSLDKPYLENSLATLSDAEKLRFITPPPSVINAYFAEIYQKQSPKDATDYYFQLSQALNLLQDQPSFEEVKPFVRLNLSGQSFGFSYTKSTQEDAIVFSENAVQVDQALLFEITQIFPHYHVYLKDNHIHMALSNWDFSQAKDISPEGVLLSKVSQRSDDIICISGYNQDEVLDIAKAYDGQFFYQFKEREFKIYITN
ncbi:cystathionine beta-lyase [Streptococcus hongkongensis]|nr:cystathionine beta-lyase [Streptococcus uberis]